MDDAEWEHIGDLDVDSGTVMLGDPCYALSTTAEKASLDYFDAVGLGSGALGIERDERRIVRGAHPAGHLGRFVTVPAGMGDGSYPVFGRWDDGYLAEVRIVFLADGDLELDVEAAE